MKKKFLVLPLVFLMVACGAKISGAYLSVDGDAKLTFKPNGYVTVESLVHGKAVAGRVCEAPYEIDGNTVKFQCHDGVVPIVLTVQKDGALTGFPFKKLAKE